MGSSEDRPKIVSRKNQKLAASEAVDASIARVEKLAAVIESLHDAVFIGDPTGITKCNRAGLEMLGVESFEEFKNLPIDEFPFMRSLRGETVVKDITVVQLQTKQRHVLRCVARPVLLNGRVVAAVIVNTDITVQKELEASTQENKVAAAHALEIG